MPACPSKACCPSSGRHLALVDLEADRVLERAAGAAPADRDHGEDVDERRAVLAEVDDLELDLGVGLDGAVHLAHGLGVYLLAARRAGLHVMAPGGLEEAAVAPEDLAQAVARQRAEGVRGVDDGRVGLLEVAYEEGARVVDVADFDCRVGPRCYPGLDRGTKV